MGRRLLSGSYPLEVWAAKLGHPKEFKDDFFTVTTEIIKAWSQTAWFLILDLPL